MFDSSVLRDIGSKLTPAMAETAPAAAPAKSPKKKTAKSKKSGPSVSDLIVKTIAASNERKGVSLAALKKALAGSGYDVEKNNSRVKLALKSLVKKGSLVQTKGTGASGSFKVSKKPAPAAAKQPVKKVAAKPKKPAVKKAPVKAAVKAAKPKKAAVKKPAAKKSPKKVKKPAAPKKAAKSPKKVKKPAVKKVAKSPKKAKAAKPKAKAAKPKAAKAKKAAKKK